MNHQTTDLRGRGGIAVGLTGGGLRRAAVGESTGVESAFPGPPVATAVPPAGHAKVLHKFNLRV